MKSLDKGKIDNFYKNVTINCPNHWDNSPAVVLEDGSIWCKECYKLKTNMIQAKIKYPSSNKDWNYKASLKKWLSKEIEFSKIDGAKFSNSMVLGVVEFDKDHCIYVLLPENVFKGDKL